MIVVFTLLVGLCAVEAVAFCVLYAWLAPWRASQMGRHLMAFGLIDAALMCLNLWALLVGPVPAWLWLGGLVTLAAVLGWRIQLVVNAQRRRP